jgi:hypothetical protein
MVLNPRASPEPQIRTTTNIDVLDIEKEEYNGLEKRYLLPKKSLQPTACNGG